MGGQRKVNPSADRNKIPILEFASKYLPKKTEAGGRVLEVASGTGQHLELICEIFPLLKWTPTELNQDMFASIKAYSDPKRVDAPVFLDASSPAETWPWPPATFDVVLNINMVHISPKQTCQGLVLGAARCLKPGGHLIMYGPFKRGGCFTGPDNGESNKEFNDYLLSLNNEFGIRDLEWVDALAKEAGLESTEIKEMPAENFCVCYSKII